MWDVLIAGIEQEDESNDRVGCGVGLVESVLGRADGLQSEEQKHACGGSKEEKTTAKTLNEEGGKNSPEQIPNGEDSMCKISGCRTAMSILCELTR